MSNDYRAIIERLLRIISRYTVISALEAASMMFLTACTLFFIAMTVEAVWYLSPVVKTTLVIVICMLTAGIGLFHGWRRFVRRPDIPEAARMVERAHPVLGDRLISAVQLGGSSDLRGQSAEIVDALVHRAASEIADLDFKAAVPSRNLSRLVRISYGVAILALASVIALPGIAGSGWYRLSQFSRAFAKPGRTVIFTLTGDASIIRGDNFTVSGFLSGNTGRPLDIVYRWNSGGPWSVKPAEVDPHTGDFTITVERPHESFQYYFDAGSAETVRYAVTVIERPVVDEIAVELVYPRYTGRDNLRRADNDGNIRALSGTEATVHIRANKPLDSMVVRWSDGNVTPGAVSGDSGEFSFTVGDEIDYYIALVDTLGIENANPITYRVTGLDDEPPVAVILSPAADSMLPLSMLLPLRYVAADDFGLSAVYLSFSLPYEDRWLRTALQGADAGKRIEGMHEWDMTALDLLPGDSVSFFLEARDNDTVNGPKIGRSDTLTVKIPSTADMMSDMLAEQDEGIERMREYSDGEATRELSLEDVERNLINRDELDWSDRNTMEQAKKYLENMQEDMKQMSETLGEVADKLSEDDMAALETIDKYRKISELMDEIADGELKTALEQITRAQVDMDPLILKQELDEFKVSTEELQEKLDRIVNLLEQVKALQRQETAKRLLEQMAAEQAELASEYRDDPENAALERQQRNLAQEMSKLEDEITDMADEVAEKFEISTDDIKDYLDKNDISGEMEDAAGQMSEGDRQAAGQRHNEVNTNLSELLEKMDEMSNTLTQNTSEEMRNRLFTAVSKLLAVSDMQERLIGQVDSESTLSGGTADTDAAARIQMESVDALRNAERSVAEFTKLMEQLTGPLENMLGLAEASMTQAVDAYTGGNANVGRSQSESALRTLNLASYALISLLDSRDGQQSGGMPGDMLQQLQQIANGQMSLNSMMMNSPQNSEMMMRLAAEQQKLAEMLSDLGRKAASDQRLREMLEGLTGDMDDNADMMRRNEDRELIERQGLDIYRRLLDARRSRREKEEPDDQRESQTAERNTAEGAESLPPGLGESQHDLDERIRQAMEDDFSPEYKRLIREYFESLIRSGEEPVR